MNQQLYSPNIPAQDNYLAEALKARNLVSEFDTSLEWSLPSPPLRGGMIASTLVKFMLFFWTPETALASPAAYLNVAP